MLDGTAVEPATVISVAAGLRQRLATDDQPRADNRPLLKRFDQTVIGTAKVTDRGEAAHQHRLHDVG